MPSSIPRPRPRPRPTDSVFAEFNMPPKKSARPSQPTEPQRQTRAGRKRQLSDASDHASDRPSSSHSVNAPSTPATRRKRVKTTTTTSVEPDVIIEEEEQESVEETTKPAPVCDVDTMEGAEMHQETSSYTKHVHFPGGRQSQTIALNDDDELERTTATHITPHPRKMSIKRRITASPGIAPGIVADGQKRQKITSSRHSLPPTITQNGELYYTVDEHNMAPLREVLSERIRVRLEIHAKRDAQIKELEAQRPLLDDAELESVEQELLVLRDRQKHTFDALTAVDGQDKLDPEMLVLESQQEFAYPDLPQDSTQIEVGESKVRHSFSQSGSQRSKEQEWETEREQFRSVIVTLSDQANDAKTKLQILEIELRSLGMGDGVDARSVLASIRESFLTIREVLEDALPGSIPDDASNSDLIEILLANVKEFATRLRTQDLELYEKSNLVVSLGAQVDGLLNHLAEAKIENARLLRVQEELQDEKDRNEVVMQDLDLELNQIADERDMREDDLEAAQKRIRDFELTVVELTSTIEKLTASLTHYRTEESRLTALITRMEQEHIADVGNMNKEREETVRDLEARIDEQSRSREGAESLAEDRQVTITKLEEQKNVVEQERDALQVELEQMTTQRDAEHDAREDAEMDLRERTNEVENLEDRVDRLEEQLAELNAQIDELRQLNETERTQREAAEADLDTAQGEIDELNTKLHSAGAQANELRQKLWQVQQTNDQRVQELEQTASKHDQQYQEAIKEEVDRREAVEADLNDREVLIEDLKAQLADLEKEMADTLAQRDERILSLTQELADKESKIEELSTDLQNTQASYELQVAQSKKDREEFENSIATLQLTITENETLIATLQQETVDESALHASEIEDRNARIAHLNHEVAEFTEQVHELQTEKGSLERRVEQEAEQMLQLQAELGDEIEALKEVVADKQAKIAVVEQKAVEADERWQDVLAAREEDIRSLQESAVSTEETVTSLMTQNEMLRRKFSEYVRRTSTKIRILRAENDRAKAIIDQEGEAILIAGEAELLALEEMEKISATISTTTRTKVSNAHAEEHSSSQSHSHSAQGVQSLKKTRSKKKRVLDSGIGIEEDESI